MTYIPKEQEITSEYIQAPRRGVVLRVPIANITHFTFADKYASAHTNTGELMLVSPLWQIEQILGDQLVRASRSCLAVKSRLTGLTCDCVIGGGWAAADGVDTRLRVAPRQMKVVRQALAELEAARCAGAQ